ncbi:putative major capsid protein [Eel River basin pequenovirus]|nr:putative major capsid protein [Eel River basin pequenovirus]
MRKRTLHDLGNYKLATGDMGELIPIMCEEALAGDTWKHKTNTFMRLLPTLFPIMHPCHVSVHHWFVPYRLIWEDYEDFITGGEDGLNASVLPTIDFSGSAVAAGDLADYLGLPVGFNSTASALPFRAYAKIYNENYRDDQIQAEIGLSEASGADTTTSTDLKNANWQKDNFTGARADEQLGTAVTLPLGTSAPVTSDAGTNAFIGVTSTTQSGLIKSMTTDGGAGDRVRQGTTTTTDGLYADLSNASAPDINQIRQAFLLQRFMELRNWTGSDHEEMLKTDFGVSPRDFRIGNPEYLGGGKETVQFSEVLDTGSSASAVGDLKGHGIAAMRTNNYIKFFPEHGLVLTFLCVKPIPMYHQGVRKHWNYDSKEDFYNPILEGLGVQAIENQEIYFAHSSKTGTHGYESRYQQYRKIPNTIAGDFHDSNLNYAHMARDFTSDTALNSSFITCNPPNSRVFAQSVKDNLLAMNQHKIAARRVVKKYAKPASLVY